MSTLLFRIFNSEAMNISICNAGKQRYVAAADLFRIYEIYFPPKTSEIPKKQDRFRWFLYYSLSLTNLTLRPLHLSVVKE